MLDKIFRKNETKRFRRLTVKSILHPVETGARPTGSTRRKTRRVSNKKFNGPASKWRLEPILEPSIKRYYTEGRNFSRSKAAAAQPSSSLSSHTHAFKSVSIRKMLSLHATLFEYSGEILATYSVTGARASPFRLFHRTLLPSRPWLPPKCNPLLETYIYMYAYIWSNPALARGQGRSLIVLL